MLLLNSESFANEADVAAAFEAGHSNARKIFSMQGQAQILLEIVPGYVVIAHFSIHQFPVVNKYLRGTLNEISEAMRIECDPGE